MTEVLIIPGGQPTVNALDLTRRTNMTSTPQQATPDTSVFDPLRTVLRRTIPSDQRAVPLSLKDFCG
jgi:hypothetical protein